MTSQRFVEIRQQAERLVSLIGAILAPVSVETIARMIGAHVRYAPAADDVSGMAYRTEDGSFIIGVNSLHSRTRKRFTIAHEIGHLMLHKGDAFHIDKGYVYGWRDADGTSGVEKEQDANAFAASLLMPEWMVRQDADRLGLRLDVESDRAIAKLAKQYEVSAQAMTYRLSTIFKIEF